ncbi:MAG TPA: SdiA-regulated domain-containing protein [Ignavibacteria bacterium]|nr:SdiA-regulated domain-containing protein [Ignavibacteria bacterium]
MKSNRLFLITVIFLSLMCGLSSCGKKKEDIDKKKKNEEKNEKKSYPSGNLAFYEIENKDVNKIELPKILKEISGIIITDDGRMFGHYDELGAVFEIDTENGEIKKTFYLKDKPEKDFEDIAYANGLFYMVTSKGDIYEFKEGNEQEEVDFTEYKTKLNTANDIEGITYDPETNSFIIACKGMGTENVFDKEKGFFKFDLNTKTLDMTPKFLINFENFKKDFNPSGIRLNPATNTYFVISSTGNAIAELSKNGEVLGFKDLPGKVHSQPEGIAFDKEGNLYISNEGADGNGNFIKYLKKGS